MKEHLYFVYILLCSDDTYYTGVTNDINRREKEHLEGYKESSYTHYRQPTLLVYQEEFQYIDKAIAREKQLKKWSQAKKRALINDYADRVPLFSVQEAVFEGLQLYLVLVLGTKALSSMRAFTRTDKRQRDKPFQLKGRCQFE